MSGRETFLTDHGRCECGKVKWASRADAKKFAKRHHQGEHVRAYACDGFWHLGHLPTTRTTKRAAGGAG